MYEPLRTVGLRSLIIRWNGHRLKWGHRRKNSGHKHFHAESDPEASTSNTTQNSAAAALSTGRPTLSSTILPSYSNYSYNSNYTFTRPTSLTSSLSNTTYLALSTSLVRPKKPTTYITITASLTSTSYVSYSNTPSLYFPNTTRAAPSTSFSTAFSPSAQPSLQSSFRSINTTTSSSSSSVRWANTTMTSSPSLPNLFILLEHNKPHINHRNRRSSTHCIGVGSSSKHNRHSKNDHHRFGAFQNSRNG
jgi:hypothetical protein